jgi:Domain of unknown function (DUF1996)
LFAATISSGPTLTESQCKPFLQASAWSLATQLSETTRALKSHKLSLGTGQSLILCDFTSLTRGSTISIDFNGPAEPQTSCWKNTKCPGSLRGQLFLRSCWDGKNLDSPDHKSHMAFPDGIDHGNCPASHPVRLVSIFYEFWHYVKPFNDLNDGGHFVLSNGDSTGCSYHGDFVEGWDTEVLQNALDQCTNLSGVIEDCPVFTSIFTSDDEMNSCAAPNPYPQEPEPQLGEVLPHIPGCVAVTGGPAPAIQNAYVPGCTALGVPAGGSGSTAMSGAPASASSSASNSHSSAPAVGTGASTHAMPSGTPAMSIPSSLGLSSLSSGRNNDISMPTTTPMDSQSSPSLDKASPTSVSHPIVHVHHDSSLSNSHTSAHHSHHKSAHHAHHTSASDDWYCGEAPHSAHHTSSKAPHSAHPTGSMAPHRRHHLRRGNGPEFF